MVSTKRKLVGGVGVNDADFKVTENGVMIKSYLCWKGMIDRCYSKRRHEIIGTYIGCSVCDEWLLFTNFKKWHDENYIEGWNLDKDLLIAGNKIYSPEACAYVPQSLNVLLIDRKRFRGKFKIGVSKVKNRKCFVSHISINGKQIRIGYFNNEDDAHKAYLIKKKEYVLSEISRYRAEHGENKRLMQVLDSVECRFS